MGINPDDILERIKPEWPAQIPRIGDSSGKETGLNLGEGLRYLGGVLALAGILVYALLRMSYDTFYGSLSVDPEDVGLNYGRVLTQSTGVVIFIASLIASTSAVTLLVIRMRTGPEQRLKDLLKDLLPVLRVPMNKVILAVGVLGLILVAGWGLVYSAGDAAIAVKSSQPIGAGGWFTLLPIRAEPVLVEPINETVSKTISSQLDCNSARQAPCAEKLFYLGQTGGTIVLYNASRQRKLYLPQSSVVLHVSNCRTPRSRDVDCENLFGQ